MGNEKAPQRKRYTFLTPEVHDRLVEAVRLGLPWPYVASYGGIARETLRQWRIRGEEETEGPYRELVDAFSDAEGDFAASNMESIRKAAQGGQWQAAAWTLERRIEDYRKPRDREEVVMREIRAAETAAERAATDPHEVLASLSVEELEALLEAKRSGS